MNTIQVFNYIPNDVINHCINDYNTKHEYDTLSMRKADPGNSLGLLQPFVESILDTKLEYCSGNFYKHSVPYLPHTDFRKSQNNYINVVIPLSFSATLPYLIVFDQLWNQDSVTWSMSEKIIDFKVNTGVKGSPFEYDVLNLTNQPIDEKFYKSYLDMYPKETLFGLSGKAYPFIIGSIIIFDNKRIHCTSKFIGSKLGISLRFKELTTN